MEWEKVSQGYSDTDIILLQANDDHAVVCQDPNYFSEFSNVFDREKSFKIAALTHFPEMQTLISIRKKGFDSGLKELQSGPIHYAIGTQLVRASFFKSWWQKGIINDDTYIFRPDNPFGQSVVFEPTQMLIPKMEIFRHMDGYGHIGMHRPLGPLRNLGNLSEFGSAIFQVQSWKVGLWPSRILAFSRDGYDIHDTFSKLNGFNKWRIGVALLQSHWALKYMPSRAKEILASLDVKDPLSIIGISTVATLSLPIIRNIPDYLILKSVQFLELGMLKCFGWKSRGIYTSAYLGIWRSIRKKCLGFIKRLN